MRTNLANIQKVAPSALLSGLKSENRGQGLEAAHKLIAQARDTGLGLKDFLRLKVDARLAEDATEREAFGSLNGYEATLAYLGLPIKDDLDGGVMLQAAADTFETFPGTRALFPEVIDDMLKWKYKQTSFENVDGMLSQTRTVASPEMISTIVDDDETDYTRPIRAIAESGRIPIHSIRTTEQQTKFYKFGTGYKTSYEFNRRASLDVLTPYAARVQTQIAKSKVAVATGILLNGDGVHGAASVSSQSTFDGKTSAAAVANKLSFEHLLAWLVARASAGYPVDTVVGNWDLYLQWLRMFALPTAKDGMTEADQLARSGFNVGGVPILTGSVNFQLSTSAPANKLIGYSVADTMEQQIEANSLIEESDRSISTQEVTYVKSENSGFRIVFDKTRDVFDLGT